MQGKKNNKKKDVEKERSGMVASVVWSEGVINGTMESEIETPKKYLLDKRGGVFSCRPFWSKDSLRYATIYGAFTGKFFS